jgi:hypothetical protein
MLSVSVMISVIIFHRLDRLLFVIIRTFYLIVVVVIAT